MAEVPRLPELLRAVGTPRVQQMRAMLERVRRAFLWSPADGGLAYNFTRLSLCHRATELSADGRLRSGADCSLLAEGLPGASPTRRWPSWWPQPLTEATQALVRARHFPVWRRRRRRRRRA